MSATNHRYNSENIDLEKGFNAEPLVEGKSADENSAKTLRDIGALIEKTKVDLGTN